MGEAAKVAALLGGRAVLHRTVRSDLDLVEAVQQGLPTAAVEGLVSRRLVSRDEVYTLISPKRTYLLRRQARSRLSPQESERATRVARILTLAADAFGAAAKAARWLRTPNRVLKDAVPLGLLATEPGARLVEDELHRIAWGLYA